MSGAYAAVYMIGGIFFLIGLLIVFAIQQYQRNEPHRAAHIAPIPHETLQRYSRNYALAAGIGLMGYGLLKCGVHGFRVASSGMRGFANVRGLVSGQMETDWIFFSCTMLLAAALFVCGVLALRRSLAGLWLSAVAISSDLLISLMIALALFGDSRVKGGLFLVLVAMSIPSVVAILVVLAIQNRLLAAQKQRMDQSAIADKVDRPSLERIGS
jgi:hypothetical protein